MNYTPEEIANIIFKDNPKEKKYYNFLIDENDDQYNLDISFVFEILIQILFEGFDILTEGLNNIDIDNLDESMINSLNPWFESFGFNIFVSEHKENKFIDNYCISIINNKLYNKIFIERNINKNFHFILNKKYANGCPIDKLENMYTIISGTTKIFKIWFNFI